MVRRVTQASQPMHYDPTTGFMVVDVQDWDEGPAPGTIIKPIPDPYDSTNNPYRGGENHGVDPIYDIPAPEDQWEGGSVPVNVPDDEEAPETVQAVRIVNKGPKEIKEWRAFRTICGQYPSIVIGKFDNRESFTLKNLSPTVTIYVGGDLQISKTQGFPVKPGESFSVPADTEVYAITDDGTDVEVACWVIFTVQVK